MPNFPAQAQPYPQFLPALWAAIERAGQALKLRRPKPPKPECPHGEPDCDTLLNGCPDCWLDSFV